MSGFSAGALAYLDGHAIDPQVARELGVTEDRQALVYPTGRSKPITPGKPKTGQPEGKPLAAWWLRFPQRTGQELLVCEDEADALAAVCALRDGPPAKDSAGFHAMPIIAIPGTGFPVDRLVRALQEADASAGLLALDGDPLGRTYRDKAADAIRQAGMLALTVELPEGQKLASALSHEKRRNAWLTGRLSDAVTADDRDTERTEAQSPAAVALDEARTDLVTLILHGIPERQWVPGSLLLIRGKRYLFVAPAGTGKSLAALVIAVGVVEAGGTTAIIDVENGSDEYARRLKRILQGRDQSVVDACRARLHYYAWPSLSLSWTAEDWGAALDGVDLAIFDSSRMALSSVGLAEDKSDDYARFARAFLLPLVRADTATLMLDNTGHGATDRARGTKAKDDLNEVVYALKATEPFSESRTGVIELQRTRTRFSDPPERLAMKVGGGYYQAPQPADPETGSRRRPTHLMEKASRALEQSQSPLGKSALRRVVRGKNEYVDRALDLLVADEFASRDRATQKYSSMHPYREADDPTVPPCPDHAPTLPRAPAQSVPPEGPPSLQEGDTGARLATAGASAPRTRVPKTSRECHSRSP